MTFTQIIEKYDLKQKSRRREIVEIKQYMCYVMRKKGYEYQEIAKLVDNTVKPVFNACRKIQSFIDQKDFRTMEIIKKYHKEFNDANEYK